MGDILNDILGSIRSEDAFKWQREPLKVKETVVDEMGLAIHRRMIYSEGYSPRNSFLKGRT